MLNLQCSSDMSPEKKRQLIQDVTDRCQMSDEMLRSALLTFDF